MAMHVVAGPGELSESGPVYPAPAPGPKPLARSALSRGRSRAASLTFALQRKDATPVKAYSSVANSVWLARRKPVFQPKAELANSPANSTNDCLNPLPRAVRSGSLA